MRERWRSRRGTAGFLSLVVLVFPVSGAVVVALTVAPMLPRARTLAGALGGWLFLAVLIYTTLQLLRRLASRLLPLVTLLRLALTFPDRAPSRVRVALRAGTIKHLRHCDEPAAEHVVTLAAALTLHDRRTRGHSERVRAIATIIGEEMGLPQSELDRLRWAALLHDVGKLSVPSAVLNRRGALDSSDWDLLRRHPEAGAGFAEPLRPWLGEWVDTVGQHHERWDGGGYPEGLARGAICTGARIVAVADAFDVLTSARSYKPSVDAVAARWEIIRSAGDQFDPAVVRAFLRVSIGRLRSVLGPLSVLAALPFLSWTRHARSLAGSVTSSTGTTTSAVLAIALAATFVSGTSPVGPEAAREALPPAASGPAVVGDRLPAVDAPEVDAPVVDELPVAEEAPVAEALETAEPAPAPPPPTPAVAAPAPAPALAPAPLPAPEPAADATPSSRRGRSCVGEIAREQANAGIRADAIAAARGPGPGGGQALRPWHASACSG